MAQEKILEYLLQFVTIYLVVSTNDYLYKNKRLKKANKYKGRIIKGTPFNINDIEEEKRIKIKAKLEQEKRDKVLNFIQKLEKNFNEEDLSLMYENLASLKIKKKPPLMGIMLSLAASYNAKKNRINIYFNRAFEHEMFHLVSAKYDEKSDIECVGFVQKKDDVTIGKGLNEGYTELLRQRYFPKKMDTFYNVYNIETNLAEMMEYLLKDKQELLKYYLKADLPGLINSLSVYANSKEVIKLIKDIDYITDFHRGFIPGPKYKAYKLILETKKTMHGWFLTKKDHEKDIKGFEEVMLRGSLEKIFLTSKEGKKVVVR